MQKPEPPYTEQYPKYRVPTYYKRSLDWNLLAILNILNAGFFAFVELRLVSSSCTVDRGSTTCGLGGLALFFSAWLAVILCLKGLFTMNRTEKSLRWLTIGVPSIQMLIFTIIWLIW
ncbi:hypothetical protein [Herpetosiphon llansteffanensis]|uniref:hypothetical protein n=1 Tax=Herpetosiphon llansteffanensis TaxID=2094568 RepID=UPI000F519EF6|nr:hypothetical protein [Herpetosiphon llansteffanensis]